MTGIRPLRSLSFLTSSPTTNPRRVMVRLAASLTALAVLAGPAAYADRSTPTDASGDTRAAADRADTAEAGPSADRTRASRSTVTIRPDRVGRGAELEGPHMANLASNTIVDGDVRVTVEGTYVHLIGTSGSSYVVQVLRDHVWSVLAVAPDGSERVVATAAGLSVLASDNRYLAVTRSQTRTRTTIAVIRVSTGRTVLRRTFPASVDVLDIRGERAIIDSNAGTYGWDLAADRTTLLTRRILGRADLRTGLLATADGDPYDGGCTVLTTIARPDRALWRSCSERVDAFSPDGRRLATIHILSDGQGPSLVRTRSVRGNPLSTYQVDGYFGGVRFESDKALLLATYGKSRAAEVRCTGSSCERASALSDTPTY